MLAKLTGDQKTGAQMLKRALEEPLRRICANAGAEGSVVIEEIKRRGPGWGLNVAAAPSGRSRTIHFAATKQNGLYPGLLVEVEKGPPQPVHSDETIAALEAAQDRLAENLADPSVDSIGSELSAFVSRIIEAGRDLRSRADRNRARSMLRFWSTVASQAGMSPTHQSLIAAPVSVEVRYDVSHGGGEYVNMIEAGIIDPLKVTRSVLENAASIATMILTTETLITELPDRTPAPAAPPMPEY